jgi:iron(III) transport system substrate-binding protein
MGLLQMRTVLIIINTPSIFYRKPVMQEKSASLRLGRRLAGVAVIIGLCVPIFHNADVHAQKASGSQNLNLYSARHYQSDDALYAAFTKQTGIKITQIQSGDEALLERIRSEGKASPADVILLADAARLWKAENEGLFQPANSAALRNAIPANMRGGDLWFGLTTRARIIVVDPAKIKPDQIKTYEDLAKPEFKGMVCTRSASHPYMLSLTGSMIKHLGQERTAAWAKGMVNNLARSPRGGDTDQIKGVASGECAVALTNSYYLVRMLKSSNAADRQMAEKVVVIWPNQSTTGTHVNISGGGIARYAPNAENARKFLEFLASPQAQAQFADSNNEWPVLAGVKVNNPELEGLGKFKADTLPVSAIGEGQLDASKLIDRAGWR